MKDGYVILRGSTYYFKPSKNLIGYNKHLERLRKLNKKHSTVFNALVVKGTLDSFVKVMAYTQSAQKEHPTDKGYFKKVTVLNERGRERLRHLKSLKKIRDLNMR